MTKADNKHLSLLLSFSFLSLIPEIHTAHSGQISAPITALPRQITYFNTSLSPSLPPLPILSKTLSTSDAPLSPSDPPPASLSMTNPLSLAKTQG